MEYHAVFCGSSLVVFLSVDNVWFPQMVVRNCARDILGDKCIVVTDAAPGIDGVNNATGVICYCHGELCNGPGSFRGSAPAAAPQAYLGRMAMSFTVISLLALARFLGQ